MVDIIVEKYSYGFRIVLSEEESYFVTDYEGKYCLVESEINRELKDFSSSVYEDFGVKNLDELFCLLVKEPKEVLRMIIGNDLQIGKIVVEYYES
jgi:hypothetical protein